MNTILFPFSKKLENQTLQQNIQITKNKDYFLNTIHFKNCKSFTTIQEYPGDCGCLLLRFVYDINKEVQDYIELFMNENGYSKIIGTIIIPNTETTDSINLLKTVKTLGYTCIETGKSARHPEYDCMSYLIYKVIKPETTGYPI